METKNITKKASGMNSLKKEFQNLKDGSEKEIHVDLLKATFKKVLN